MPKIIPAGNYWILDVLQDNPTPTTLGNNERILLLVHVHLEQPPPGKQAGHVRQRSDELIEYLEYQLGDSRLEYLRVVVKYNHSAFPPPTRSDAVDGVVEVGTKLETSAIAIIKYHNCRSLWSPCPAPTINPVLRIVYDCWEPEKARNAMRRMRTQPSVPHKVAKTRSRMNSPVEDKLALTRTPPAVPRREASLGKDSDNQNLCTAGGPSLGGPWQRIGGSPVRHRGAGAINCNVPR
ncbi:LOW QUALITY PROTEIN: ubiquitin-conjugating enzyme [Colletotrichum tofieldiae]|nr:LOW QUALITY PROTEIN: ubiquitin-conjugating enzyme [Colletotrichum tofieldiae]